MKLHLRALSSCLLPIVATTLVAACAAARPPASRPHPSAPGFTLAVAGPVLGEREVKPSLCIAGGHYSFFGADLIDETHNVVVRAVIDPIEGTVVRVFDGEDPDRVSVVFHRRDCSHFVATLKPTGSWVNGIDLLALTLDLDCLTANGDAVVGTFTASECK